MKTESSSLYRLFFKAAEWFKQFIVIKACVSIKYKIINI